MTRGLKCGGTLQERASRLFSVKGVSPEDIDPALKAKTGKGGKNKSKKWFLSLYKGNTLNNTWLCSLNGF